MRAAPARIARGSGVVAGPPPSGRLAVTTAAVAAVALAAPSLVGCAAANAGLPLDYRVGAYREYATLYTPAVPERAADATAARGRGGETPVAPRRLPAVVVLHGGFWGDDAATDDVALALRARHVLAVVPSYRGEERRLDGRVGDGAVEFCAGEVDDALAVVQALRARPDVDPERIAVLGFSHGGCIALRAAALDPRLAAVVEFAGPVDAAYTMRFLEEHPMGMFGFAGWLRGRVESYVGSTPESAPGAWKARSPLYAAASLRPPLVVVHGTEDAIVPVRETCMLRDALAAAGRPVEEGYFEKNGTPDPSPAPVCPPPPRAGREGAAGAPVRIWYFEGEGHVFSAEAMNAAVGRAADFLVRVLRPPWTVGAK